MVTSVQATCHYYTERYGHIDEYQLLKTHSTKNASIFMSSKNSRTFMWVQIGQFNNLQNRLFYLEKIRSLLVQKNCMHRKMIKSALKLNSYYLIEKYSNDFWLSIKPFNLVISVMVTLWFFNMS